MPAIQVDPIQPVTWTAIRVTPENISDLHTLITGAKEQKHWHGKLDPVTLLDGSVGWQVEFLFADGTPPCTAHPGYWAVSWSNGTLEVFDPPTAVTKYGQNVPMEWDGLTTPPAVTVNPDGTLHVRFRQPESINGPWTYELTRTDLADNSTAVLNPLGDIVVHPIQDASERVVGADVMFNVNGGMTTGHRYQFTIKATTGYGTEATTPPSSTLTLPEQEG